MKSLGYFVSHEALHSIGAVSVVSGVEGTQYEPDDLDLTGLDAAILAHEPKPPTYQQLRAIEYAKRNQFEMQYDDAVNGTTTWVDWQDGIKAAIPKPPIAT